MELTRRQFAWLLAGLYCVGAGLLLLDYAHQPGLPGAHLPMAWHVFPISVAVTAMAAIAGTHGPLDPVWPVSVHSLILMYVLAVLACGAAIVWIVSGRPKPDDKKPGN